MSQQPTLQMNAETGMTIIPPVNKDIASRKRARYSVSANQKLLPNPDVILRKAGKTIEAYRDLLKDAHVASCVQSRKAGLLALEWEINAENAQTDIVDLVKKQFESLDLPRILSELMDASLFGYSISEVMWRYDGDDHCIASDIIGKPQEWFRFDERGQPYFTAANTLDGEELEDRKFIVVQHSPSYLNPYGEAVLSRCYWPVTFKKQLLSHMMVFAEKYGMPYMISYYDPFIGGGASSVSSTEKSLDDLHADGTGVFPNTQRVEILDTAKTPSIDVYMRGIVFFNAEVSKAVLSQTLTTEQGDTGSYAMSQTHLMVRKDVVDADRRLIERAMNTFVRWLVDINWMDVESYPTFRMYEQTDVDQALVQRDVSLATGLGVRFGKDYISEAHNIDPRQFELADPAAAAAGAPTGFAARRRLINDSQEQPVPIQVEGTRLLSTTVSDTLGFDADEAAPAIDALLKPVIEKIRRGRSYEEINDTLASIFPEMSTEQLEATLANSLFMADLVGRSSTR